jgi:poly(3-hydroxybutyrate) depolymerase
MRACVMVLHGGAENGVAGARNSTRFSSFAQARPSGEGFVVVYPQAMEDLLSGGPPRYNWNDGRNVSSSNEDDEGAPVYDPAYPGHSGWSNPLYSHEKDVNDIAFLSALMDLLNDGTLPNPNGGSPIAYDCNPDRMYMVGSSNGGMMVQRFLLEGPEGRIAAAGASASAHLPARLYSNTRAAPAPMLLIAGLNDVLQRPLDWEDYVGLGNPWDGLPNPLSPLSSDHEGGWACQPNQDGADPACTCVSKIGQIMSAEATVNFWADRNACELGSPQIQLGDSTTVDNWNVGCANDYNVRQYIVGEGGHSWPGNPNENIFSKCAEPFDDPDHRFASDDFDATQEVWDFFEQYPFWVDEVEECIIADDGSTGGNTYDHLVVEGFWRGKLRPSTSGDDTVVTLKIRGTPVLNAYGLAGQEEIQPIWRIYDVGTSPLPGALWTSADIDVNTEGHIIITLSAPGRLMSGTTERWVEVLIPDYDVALDDGITNFVDLGQLKNHFLSNPAAVEYDFNRDGAVNFVDLGLFKSGFFFSHPCPGGCPVGSCPNYPYRD